MSVLSFSIDAVERGVVPDRVVRAAIRRLCRQRLRECDHGSPTANQRSLRDFVATMCVGPIAPVPEKANQQHYELPSEFFAAVLGRHRKYSSCLFTSETMSLDDAESKAIQDTCQLADLRDGQRVLELGCGWGSLSLWLAHFHPRSQITAVSNSASQRQYIQSQAALRGYQNLQVITADMNEFDTESNQFERVVSIEMFEHMRNYQLLLKRISGWLKPEGKLFVHHFCHREFAYPFESEGEANWMGRYFFTGGIMPSENLLRNFGEHMHVVSQLNWPGSHYQRTANAWLANLDARRSEVWPILVNTYGRQSAARWFHRWRMFFMSVAELFGYDHGSQWFVTQVVLQPNQTQ
ncbi:MAG: class I SAM-dependent methyltransferase [Pirellulaceae bacterium]|nr:class I SAM-dependent methyltransferase [Pirellulaceae bacterium]